MTPPFVWPVALAELGCRGVTADSRQIQPGFVFVALQGARADGRAHIADAVARGAVAVIAAPGTSWPGDVPQRPLIEDAEPRRLLAYLAADLAGAQPELAVAVTGTNGKTSTVEFLRQIWAESGFAAASLGTLGVRSPILRTDSGLTTPDPVALAQTLAVLAQQGVQRVALEASSHGLDQFRLDGVRLAAGAFTNLTRDHLDYHGTQAAYRTAKLRLFRDLLPQGAPAVACADMEPATLAALQDIAQARGLRLLSVGEAGRDVRLIQALPRPEGQHLVLEIASARHEIEIALPGRFQADNVLIAATLAQALGQDDVWSVLPRLKGVRGRMEHAATLPNGAAVYVDYAHTPDALERLLLALRPHARGALHVVFGAGGDRDRGKRPLMGGVAARLADYAVVTDDNPRSENPSAIRAEIMAGCTQAASGSVVNVEGRAAAIAQAMNALQPGDVLVIAGKGHEQGQTIGDQVLPFDDLDVARRLAGVA